MGNAVLLSDATTGFNLEFLTTNGLALVTFLISAMGQFLSFMSSNPGLFVWMFASLAAMGLKFIRGFF